MVYDHHPSDIVHSTYPSAGLLFNLKLKKNGMLKCRSNSDVISYLAIVVVSAVAMLFVLFACYRSTRTFSNLPLSKNTHFLWVFLGPQARGMRPTCRQGLSYQSSSVTIVMPHPGCYLPNMDLTHVGTRLRAHTFALSVQIGTVADMEAGERM